MSTALSFSGAGAKIILEIGYAQAYEQLVAEQAIEPYSILTGTSSGALIAAALHSGQVNEFQELAINLKNSNVYSFNPLKVFGHQACIFDNEPLRRLLKGFLDCNALRANKRPCIINCTDISAWKSISTDLTQVQDNDQIIELLLSSTAVPMAFPCNNNLVDGGLMMDYPIFNVIGSELDLLVLFVNSIVQPKAVHGIKDMIEQVASLTLYNQLLQSLQALAEGKFNTNVLLVMPDKPVEIDLLDFQSISKQDKLAWIAYAKNLALEKLHPGKVSVQAADAIIQLKAQRCKNLQGETK